MGDSAFELSQASAWFGKTSGSVYSLIGRPNNLYVLEWMRAYRHRDCLTSGRDVGRVCRCEVGEASEFPRFSLPQCAPRLLPDSS